MMPAIVLALALDVAQPRWRAPQSLFESVAVRDPWTAPMAWHGQFVRTDTLHMGARANILITPGEIGAAVTLQISFRSPL